MKEGWHNDDYLILFDEEEIALASERYDMAAYLSGFEIVGLQGWDNFILRSAMGTHHLVPTVPLDARYLSEFVFPETLVALEPDPRFTGRIKWYLKPIVFGGDPSSDSNLEWVGRDEHEQLVRWWNELYRGIDAAKNV